MNSKKVAVALSGGIDSAVTALLLKQQGYSVIGITGKMTRSEEAENVIINAQNVAESIGIEHYVVDATDEFKAHVIDYFETSYKQGLTPNPCIMCNKYIKWGKLYNFAINELKADFIATGHYANIKKDGNIYKLYPASDEHKDQLYFLYQIPQEQLAKTLFPLAKYQKNVVKEIAEKYNLPPKSSKESQDICFIKPPITTKKYLNQIFQIQEGNFVEKSSGKILGKHTGYWQYTIGQRKGIGLASSEALYVVGINSQTNTVYVGFQKELLTNHLKLKNINWSYPIIENEFEALVKIRYNMTAILANIKVYGNDIEIEFKSPVSGLAPGQACVLYNNLDGHLLGGGII